MPDLIEKEIPLMGICYGHQLIAKALGGRVENHPQGMELGTVDIQTNDSCGSDYLFKGLPRSFKAHVSHSQTVIELPENAVLLAGNLFERHHAFRIGISAWGVQFHPEYNKTIMNSYIENIAKHSETIKVKKQALIENVQETPFAASVIKRFGRLLV